MWLATLTGSAIHFDTGAHWEQLLMDAQPAGAPSQRAWAPVRQALAEITSPVEQDSRRVAERLSTGDQQPIRSLLRLPAESVSKPITDPAPHILATQLR